MKNDVQTAVRLPAPTVRALDKLAAAMSRQSPGLLITRASLIRMMVMEGLRARENKALVNEEYGK